MNILSTEWTQSQVGSLVQTPNPEKRILSAPDSDRHTPFQSWLERDPANTELRKETPTRHSDSPHTPYEQKNTELKEPPPKTPGSARPEDPYSPKEPSSANTHVEEDKNREEDPSLLEEKDAVWEEEIDDEEEASVDPHLLLLLDKLSLLPEEERKRWITMVQALQGKDIGLVFYGSHNRKVEGMSKVQAVQHFVHDPSEQGQTPTSPEEESSLATEQTDPSLSEEVQKSANEGLQTGMPAMDPSDRKIPLKGIDQKPARESSTPQNVPIQKETKGLERVLSSKKTDSSEPKHSSNHSDHEVKKAMVQNLPNSKLSESASERVPLATQNQPKAHGKEKEGDHPKPASNPVSDQRIGGNKPSPTGRSPATGSAINRGKNSSETVSAQGRNFLVQETRSSGEINGSISPNQGKRSENPDRTFLRSFSSSELLPEESLASKSPNLKEILPNPRTQSPSLFVRMKEGPKEAITTMKELVKLGKTFLERYQQIRLEQGGLKVRVEEFVVRKMERPVPNKYLDLRSGKPLNRSEQTDPTQAKPSMARIQPKDRFSVVYDRQPTQGRIVTVSQLMDQSNEQPTRESTPTTGQSTSKHPEPVKSYADAKASSSEQTTSHLEQFIPKLPKNSDIETQSEERTVFGKYGQQTLSLEHQIRFSPEILQRNMEEVIQKVQEVAKLARQTLHTATIQLNPPQMGKVEVEVQKMGLKVIIHMNTETEQAKEMLQRNSHLLVSRLSSSGYDVQRVQIHMEKQEEQGDQQQQSHHRRDDEQQQHPESQARQRKDADEERLSPAFPFAELLKGVEQHA